MKPIWCQLVAVFCWLFQLGLAQTSAPAVGTTPLIPPLFDLNLDPALPEQFGLEFIDRLIKAGQTEITKNAIQQQIEFFKTTNPDYARRLQSISLDELAQRTVDAQAAQSAYMPSTGNKLLDMLQRNGVPVLASNLTQVAESLDPDKRNEKVQTQFTDQASTMMNSVLRSILRGVAPDLFDDPRVPIVIPVEVTTPPPTAAPTQNPFSVQQLANPYDNSFIEQFFAGPRQQLQQQQQEINQYKALIQEQQLEQQRIEQEQLQFYQTIQQQLNANQNRQAVSTNQVTQSVPSLPIPPPLPSQTNQAFAQWPPVESPGLDPVAIQIAESLRLKGVNLTPTQVRRYVNQLLSQNKLARQQLAPGAQPEQSIIQIPTNPNLLSRPSLAEAPIRPQQKQPANTASGIFGDGNPWSSQVHEPVRVRTGINQPVTSTAAPTLATSIDSSNINFNNILQQFAANTPPTQPSLATFRNSGQSASGSLPNPAAILNSGPQQVFQSAILPYSQIPLPVQRNAIPSSLALAHLRSLEHPNQNSRLNNINRRLLSDRSFNKPRRFDPQNAGPGYYAPTASLNRRRLPVQSRPKQVAPVTGESGHRRLRFSNVNEDRSNQFGGEVRVPSFLQEDAVQFGLGGDTQTRQERVVDLKLPSEWTQPNRLRTIGARIYNRDTKTDSGDAGFSSPVLGIGLGR